ncbi:TlpA disulfide reductase family protein [Flavobacteriaceae sp. LMIT009]
MRKLTMLLTVAAVVVSCKSEPKIDYALVSGKIDNAAGKTVMVSGNDFKHEIEINEDGTFSDTLKIVSNGYYSFNHGRENSNMYLSHGDDIKITLDTKEFDETIKYEGVGSGTNNYLAAKYLADEKVTADRVSFYSLEEEAFKKQLEELKTGHLKNLEAEGINKDFIEKEKKNLEFDVYAQLGSYERMHGYFAKKQDFKVSDGFLPEALISMSFDSNEDYANFASYKTLAMDKYMGKIMEALGDDYQNAAPEDFKVFEEIKIPALKNDIISQVGSILVSPGNPNMVPLYNFFVANVTDEEFKKKLTAKYDKNKNLVKGMPSPQFTDYENHKGGTMSLADLKGKFVYIDVWATWCGPCKREIPFLKEVESKYHGKNIEFVSASIDRMKDHEAWVEMVKDKQLGGHQLFADKDWQSDFVKGYGIEGIPRFILVDPDGNIVSADAPRPSNPKLIELFTELKI